LGRGGRLGPLSPALSPLVPRGERGFRTIGFGAMFVSWMNDSGFWVVGKLNGFTEKETLKTWTVVVTVNSLVGLLTCLLLSVVLPFKPH